MGIKLKEGCQGAASGLDTSRPNILKARTVLSVPQNKSSSPTRFPGSGEKSRDHKEQRDDRAGQAGLMRVGYVLPCEQSSPPNGCGGWVKKDNAKVWVASPRLATCSLEVRAAALQCMA